MKTMKRLAAFTLVLCMLTIVVLPTTAISVDAARDSYYEEIGISYEQLFNTYPNYLNPEQETAVVTSLMNAYKAALGEYGGDHDFLPSFIYALDQGGKDILSSEILAEFGIGKFTEEKLIAETSEALMREILKTESELASVTSEISSNFKSMKSTYNIATSAGKLVFINDLKSSCKNLSNSEIDKLADSLLKEESKLMNNVADGIEFWQLIVGIVELKELQEESICQLRDAMEDNSDFAKALDDLLAEIEKDPVAYMLEYYCTDKALELLSDAIETAFLAGHFAPSKLTVALANIVISIITKLYPGTTADEIYQTTLLSSYVSEFDAAITSHRAQFILKKVNGELLGQDEIAEYEYLYNAYITTIRETLKNAMDTAKTDGQRGNIQNAIALCNTFTYDTYIQWCMTAVKADIDAGVIAAPGSVAGNVSACVKGTYPAYGAVTITKDNANIMDRPCSVNTDVTAKKIEAGALNAEYVVTGLCLNTADNYWYQVVTKAGETGYIYSNNCEHRAFLNDVTVSGLDVPTHISVGSRYYIRGTISTVYTNLTNISYIVYDDNGNKRTGGTVDVNGKTYVLDYSAIDAVAEFNLLEAGTYHCVLEATVENYTATDCIREKLLLDTAELVVGNKPTTIGAYNAQTVVSLANQHINGTWPNGLCLAYIATLFNQSYGFDGNVYSSCCAYQNGNRFIDTTSRNNIPLGACVYFGGSSVVCGCGNYAGHIGIYVGNNNIIHSWAGNIVCTSIDYVINCGYPYRGYGWYADQPLSTDSVPVAAYDELTATDDGLLVRGWAFDPDTVNEAVSIQVYLNGAYWKTVVANTSRPDVHSAHGCGENHGFAFTIPVTKAGTYSVQLYAVNTTAGAANLDMGTKEITITHTHSYKETYTQKTTCTTAGYTIYTCSGCGDSYTEYPGQWSQWSTEYPTGVPEGLIQQKTQYKNRKKKYTTSTEATLEGWTICGTDISDWSAEKTTTSKPTESDNLRITKTTQTGWGYYHYCNYYYNGGSNWNVDSIQHGNPSYWHGYTSSVALPSVSFQDQGGQQAYGGTGSEAHHCDYNFYIWFRNPSADVYTYTYQTREIVNRFYQWSGWSSWQDEKATSSENRQVKTQTVYRYNTSADAYHTYKDDCDTSCNLCGAKREAKHNYISNCDASCGVCGAVRSNGDKHTLASNGICLHCNTTFGDVSFNSWQISPVVYTYNTGLMAGKGADAQGRIKFDPNSPISREEFVQVLYNAEGKPSVSIANIFPDVAANGWYKNAVLWANSKNIANGMGNGNFGIGKSITRQDLALMLYKYAAIKNLDMTAPTGEINKYADGSKVSGYAQTAMNWAVKNGVLSGKGTAGKPLSTFRLDPAGTATRAECAAMLKNFMTAFGL